MWSGRGGSFWGGGAGKNKMETNDLLRAPLNSQDCFLRSAVCYGINIYVISHFLTKLIPTTASSRASNSSCPTAKIQEYYSFLCNLRCFPATTIWMCLQWQLLNTRRGRERATRDKGSSSEDLQFQSKATCDCFWESLEDGKWCLSRNASAFPCEPPGVGNGVSMGWIMDKQSMTETFGMFSL